MRKDIADHLFNAAHHVRQAERAVNRAAELCDPVEVDRLLLVGSALRSIGQTTRGHADVFTGAWSRRVPA